MKWLSVFILLIFVACSPQKQLCHLQKKHPYLFKIDTITKTDTIILPGTIVENGFSLEDILNLQDTIFIEKKKVITKIYYKNDTVFIQTKCPPDTVYVTKKIYINNQPIEKKQYSVNTKIAIITGLILGICIILAFIKKIFGKWFN